MGGLLNVRGERGIRCPVVDGNLRPQNLLVVPTLHSLYALACVRAEPQLAVPVLTKALRDPNSTVRFVACVALAKLGEEAKQAVPHLLDALEDPDREVRHLAIYALRSLDPEAAAKAGVQ